ncbi:hypothetical protein WA158_007040 [Blastocystis sp. Blastoise]
MIADVSILGCESGDSHFGFIVQLDKSKYLFNCGDGTQRICMEYKVHLKKLNALFLSSLTPEKIGGLAGMLLTIYDIGVRKLDIYGPEGIINYVMSLQAFIKRPDFKITIREIFDESFCFENKNEQFFVQPIFTNDYSDNISENYYSKRIYKDHINSENNYKLERIQSFCDFTLYSRKSSTPSSYSGHLSFIFGLHPTTGKFLPQKAISLGVPKGPMFAKLKKEGSVTLSNGNIIDLKDVTEPAVPGPLVAYVDIDTVYSLEMFLKSSTLNHYINEMNNNISNEHIISVFHHVTNDIFTSNHYSTFRNSIPNSVSQYITGKTIFMIPTVFTSVSVTHKKLASLCPYIFNPLSSSSFENQSYNIIHPLSTLSLLPERVMGKYTYINIEENTSNNEIQKEINSIPHFLEYILFYIIIYIYIEYKQEINTIRNTFYENIEKNHVFPRLFKFGSSRIHLLGTGSALPSKYRNVSGTLLFLNVTTDVSGFPVLLDCGEGTVGQIYRLFGVNTTKDILRNIKFVYISHSHADHHLGLPLLLSQRRNVTKTPLIIIGPDSIVEFLNCIIQCNPQLKNSFYFISSRLYTYQNNSTPLRKEFETLSIHINYNNEICSFVYTGDCRPNPYLQQYIQNTDLILHESTFGGDKLGAAREKHHSTVQEALYICDICKVYRCILTHFSQRYPKTLTQDQGSKKNSNGNNNVINNSNNDNIKDTLNNINNDQLLEKNNQYYQHLTVSSSIPSIPISPIPSIPIPSIPITPIPSTIPISPISTIPIFSIPSTIPITPISTTIPITPIPSIIPITPIDCSSVMGIDAYYKSLHNLLNNQFMSDDAILQNMNKHTIQFNSYLPGWDYMSITIKDMEWLPQITCYLDTIQSVEEETNETEE